MAKHWRVYGLAFLLLFTIITSSAIAQGEEAATPLASSSEPAALTDGWYAASEEVLLSGGLVIDGDVHLILADDALLTISGPEGLTLSPNSGLTIHTRSNDVHMGRLVAETCAGEGLITVLGGIIELRGENQPFSIAATDNAAVQITSKDEYCEYTAEQGAMIIDANGLNIIPETRIQCNLNVPPDLQVNGYRFYSLYGDFLLAEKALTANTETYVVLDIPSGETRLDVEIPLSVDNDQERAFTLDIGEVLKEAPVEAPAEAPKASAVKFTEQSDFSALEVPASPIGEVRSASRTFKAVVLDQYGRTMSGLTADIECKTSLGKSGITFDGGVLTVTNASSALKGVSIRASYAQLKASAQTIDIVKPASAPVSIDIAQSEEVNLPGIGEASTTTRLTAQVFDQYGFEMRNAPISWSVDSLAGIEVDARSGKVTVTDEATPGMVHVRAHVGDISKDTDVAITLAQSIPSRVEISAPETLERPIAAEGARTVDCTAIVYDQYGVKMPGETTTWTVSGAGASINADKLTVSTETTKITLTAAHDSGKKATAKIDLSMADRIPAAIVISGDDAIEIPAVGKTAKTAKYTAAVADQYGEAMKNQVITWTAQGNGSGVTLADGKLTVNPAAKNSSVTVNATCGAASADFAVDVKRAAQVATRVSITAPETLYRPTTTEATLTSTCTAAVYDQYETEILGEAITWTVSGAGASMSGDQLTVSTDTAKITLTAAHSSGKKATAKIDLSMADRIPMAIAISGDSAIEIPAMGKDAKTARFAAAVTDQYGEPMENQEITWTAQGNGSGVTLAGDTLTVNPAAENSSVTVTATCGAASADFIVDVQRAAQVATSVAITSPEAIERPTAAVATSTLACTAIVYDQYEAEILGESVAWTVSGAGASMSGDQLTVSTETTTITLTAEHSSGKKATVQIDLSTAERVQTAIAISGDSAIEIPATGKDAKTAKYAAAVTDQYGEPMENQEITWTMQGNGSGVTLAGDTLTVNPAAENSSVTVTATCGAASSDFIVDVQRAAQVATSVAITAPEAVERPTAAVAVSTMTCTAIVYDQYEAEILGETVAWTVSGAGASMSGDQLTVSTETTTITLTAAHSSGKKATAKIDLSMADRIPMAIAISGDSAIEIPAMGKDAKTAKYAAAVTDQYGEPMENQEITWTAQGNGSGVTLAGDTLTVNPAAENSSVTVTATCGAASANIMVEVQRAAQVATSVAITAPEAIERPTAAIATSTLACTAIVYDQYEAEILGETVAWTVSGAGASMSGDQLTVSTETAKITLTAEHSSGKNATVQIDLSTAERVQTAIAISGDDTVAVPAASGEATVRQYSAAVYDQYGDLFQDQSVAWSMTGGSERITLQGSSLTVMPGAAEATVRITASAGDASETLDVNVSRQDARVGTKLTITAPAQLSRPTKAEGSLEVDCEAILLDQYGTEMADPTINWAVSGVGASIDAGTGKLTVTNQATSIILTASDTASDCTDNLQITLAADPQIAAVKISGGSSAVSIPRAGHAANTEGYSASVYDQYGDLWESQGVTWSASGLGNGITFDGGTLTVTSDASETYVTINAANGEMNDSITVSIHNEKPVPTKVTISGYKSIGILGVTLPVSYNYTVTVQDQYGELIEDASVVWTSDADPKYISFAGGKLTIERTFLSATVTIRATCENAQDELMVNINNGSDTGNVARRLILPTPAPTEAPEATDSPMPEETPAPAQEPEPTEAPSPTETPAPTEAPAEPEETPAPTEAPVEPEETPSPEEDEPDAQSEPDAEIEENPIPLSAGGNWLSALITWLLRLLIG